MNGARPPRALTRAEVREVDRRAIEELGLPGLVLMENAGLGLTRAVLRALADRSAAAPARVAIVCGAGNNGGDGLVLARHLQLAGHDPQVLFCGDRARADRRGDAGVNLTVVERAGIALTDVRDGAALRAALRGLAPVALLVDALYGTGLAGPLREPGLSLVGALADCGLPTLAVDIPSGLDCDTGQPVTPGGPVVRALRTVTFVAEKAGFQAAGAREYTGAVEVVPIGCPPSAWDHVRDGAINPPDRT